MKNITVAKFGGSSLSDANQIRKVVDIIRSDSSRKYIVPSAPEGITDLLYTLHAAPADSALFQETFQIIYKRFNEIIEGLGLCFNAAPYLDTLRSAAIVSDSDFVVSYGEFLMAHILAEALGYRFVDSAFIIKFDSSGKLDIEETMKNHSVLHGAQGYVIPGFYGSLPSGIIKTLGRNSSDISGALIAKLTGATLYEKWTRGVSGVCMADPKIIPEARKIAATTYRELRELSYSGATVLHDNVIPLLQTLGIPLHVRNTDEPDDKGTIIFRDAEVSGQNPGLIGMAGRKNFTVFTLTKTLMNEEVGFLRRVCGVFENFKVNIEHTPWGIDTWMVVVESDALANNIEHITAALGQECRPDCMKISGDRALICVVGYTLKKSLILDAIESEGIKIRMIGYDEENDISTIIGVRNEDYERATRALYNAFIK